MTFETIFAGFGGQGILFAGKAIAYAGMIEDMNVSHLPSYGPEMRGGTCNCHVIVSDEPVASPIIVEPTALIAMNAPSFDKFEGQLVPGGKAIVDSTLVSRDAERTDIDVYKVPATDMANKMGLPKLANMILVGKLVKETGMFTLDQLKAAITKLVPAGKPELLENNIKTIEAGFNYSEQ